MIFIQISIYVSVLHIKLHFLHCGNKKLGGGAMFIIIIIINVISQCKNHNVHENRYSSYKEKYFDFAVMIRTGYMSFIPVF